MSFLLILLVLGAGGLIGQILLLCEFLIERQGFQVVMNHVKNGRCPFCGENPADCADWAG